MIQKTTRLIAILLILAGILFLAQPVHSQGTDEIRDYAIDIQPQEDGSVVNSYAIDWCVISNSAGPLSWITLGMPNENYEIMGFSGDIASVIPYNQDFDTMVRIDLPQEVYAGECVTLNIQIHQYGLAKLDEGTGEIGFYFTPGWFNEVPIDHMRITWHLPSDETLIKSINPKPSNQEAGLATWEDALQPGEKFPVSVIYDAAAFPNFNPDQTASSSSVSPTIPVYPTSEIIAYEDGGSQAYDVPGLFGSLSLGTCVCLCIIAIIVLLLIFVIFRSGSSTRSYRGGGYFGGYPTGGGWTTGGGGSSRSSGGSVFRIPDRSGGGSGAFGGRGSSCACVSSGCACACAGGGRAGCSRKGFDVSGLIKGKREGEQP